MKFRTYNIKIKYHYLTIILICIVFISCNIDRKSPTINITQPTDHSFHQYGGEVYIDALLEDDNLLSSIFEEQVVG